MSCAVCKCGSSTEQSDEVDAKFELPHANIQFHVQLSCLSLKNCQSVISQKSKLLALESYLSEQLSIERLEAVIDGGCNGTCNILAPGPAASLTTPGFTFKDNGKKRKLSDQSTDMEDLVSDNMVILSSINNQLNTHTLFASRPLPL